MKDVDVITGETVEENTPYSELIDIIEDAFISYQNGNVVMPDKTYVDVEKHNGDFRSMPAYIMASDWEASGVKWVNVHPDNQELDTVMGTVIYTDPETGQPLAVMDGTELTKRRTAAVSAIATDHLAEDSITTLGILGAGVQAYEQVRAIEQVRDFDTLHVSDIDDKAVESFKQEFNSYTVLRKDPSELTTADVLCTTTPVEDPVIDTVDANSIHINAMGADAPQKQEFNSKLTTGQDMNIIVDSYTQAMHSGEISIPMQTTDFTQKDIFANLSEIVSGNITEQPDKTMFDSTGLAIQDISAAYLVYTNL